MSYPDEVPSVKTEYATEGEGEGTSDEYETIANILPRTYRMHIRIPVLDFSKDSMCMRLLSPLNHSGCYNYHLH
jgi:hypothetical protein